MTDTVATMGEVARWTLGVLLLTSLVGCRCTPSKVSAESLPELVDVSALPAGADGTALIDRLQQFHQSLPVPVFSDAEEDAVPRTLEEIKQGFKLRDHEPLKLEVPIAWADDRSDPNWHSQVNAWRPLRDPLSSYRTTGEPELIELSRKVVFDWIDYNLVRNEDNAKKWHDTAVAGRAEKLAFVIDDGLRKRTLDAQQLATLLSAARRHAEFLADPDKLAKNNHAVFMLAGLSLLCKGLPELIGCASHIEYVDETWPKVVRKQFSPQGVHTEGAPTYHLMVLRMFKRFEASGVFNPNPIVAETITNAEAILPWLFHPNGEMVLIGDSESSPLSSAPSTPGVVFMTSEGAQGLAPVDVSAALADSGYYVYRSPWAEKPFAEHTFLLFSPGSRRPGHSHPDDFTFEWSELGQPIIVDSGKFTYKGGKWRDFFASTRAGNSVEIDEKNHVKEPLGSRLTARGTGKGLYFAEARVERKGSGVTHTRLLVGKPREWLCVIDTLESARSHRYVQWLGAHETLHAEQANGGVVLTGARSLPPVHVQPLERASVETIKGLEGKRPQGWISRRYDKKEPRYSIGFKLKGQDVRFTTLLSLQGAAENESVHLANGRLTVKWSSDEGAQGFSYDKGVLEPIN